MGTPVISFSLPAEVLTAISERAAQFGMPRSALITKYLRAILSLDVETQQQIAASNLKVDDSDGFPF